MENQWVGKLLPILDLSPQHYCVLVSRVLQWFYSSTLCGILLIQLYAALSLSLSARVFIDFECSNILQWLDPTLSEIQ